MYKGRLDYSFRALESVPFSSEDKDLIKDYVNRLKAEGLSESRLSDQIYSLIVLRRGFSCNFKDASKKDLENLMIWLNGQKYTPYSRMMRTNTLKRFYKWIRTDSIDKNIPYPPEVSWIHVGVKEMKWLSLKSCLKTK